MISFGRLAFAAFLIAGCNGPGSTTTTADAMPGCDTPLACCRAGDASACEPAALLAPEAGRREPLLRGCELGRAPLCLRAAVSFLGQRAGEFERLATRGCKLDPRAWISGTNGEELSCAHFDREVAERAERLGNACRSAEPGSCRALGELVRSYDGAMAKHVFSEECSAGGLVGEDIHRCERFLDFLASPPHCPSTPRTTTVSYGRCPSEAKAPPKHPGRLRLGATADSASQPLRRAVEASSALRYCYAAGLVEAPKLSGSVRLTALVGRHGRILDVSTVGSRLEDPLALECFAREAGELRPNPSPSVPTTMVALLELRP